MMVETTPVKGLLESGSESFFEFAKDLGGTLMPDGVFKLSEKAGAGGLKDLRLTNGISVRAFDFTLLQALDINRPSLPAGTEEAFTVICILTPDYFVLDNINQHRQFNIHGLHTALLVSDHIDLGFHIFPQHRVKSLSFKISLSWIKEYTSQAPCDIQGGLESLLNNYSDTILQEAYAQEDFLPIKHLHQKIFSNVETQTIKEETEDILKKFFAKLFSQSKEDIDISNQLYFQKMREAESMLMQHLTSRLPVIENIARKLALSESTLKRYFKAIYGKTVYDYYLDKKMQYARGLLEERGMTVNEVAEKVGYEKVSSFTNTFKKYTGILPGRLKKR